jgi:UDP-glucose 4-epimerase
MLKREKENILITGGAGYIGSSLAWALDKKFKIIILDDLSTGSIKNISPEWDLYRGCITNKKQIKEIFFHNKISIVIHAAAKISVAESELKKELYNKVNLSGTKNLIIESKKHKYLKHFIFSSSAAIYGNPKYLPIDENHPKLPINYYGKTKLKSENYILNELQNTKIRISILRYFNVSGIANNYKSGFSNIKNPNLISKICLFVNKKKKINLHYYNKSFNIFPERDFIHIEDIIKIYKHLIFKNKKSLNIFNCCTSKTLSLIKIVKIIEKIINKKIKYNLKKLPSNECVKIQGKKPKFMNYTRSHKSMIFSAAKWYLKF